MVDERRRGGGGLSEYRRKRSAGATPEPPGSAPDKTGPGSLRPARFVIQQHAARRLHWDLRLEVDGVLRSWAVPRGPSLDPAEKRLAVETEDHPLEYADFEGVIPRGNYGAGSMIVWDKGLFHPHLDPAEGPATGKYLFELEGYKLRGLWTLVRTKKSGEREPSKEWLLIKKPDGWATGEDATDLAAGSVLSGLSVEELAEGGRRAGAVREAVAGAGAERRQVEVNGVRPMLAQGGGTPFTRAGWLFELKYDGYRLLAGTGEGAGPGAPRSPGGVAVRLVYRSGRDATAAYPDLVRALGALPYRGLVLDGEVVALDEAARPSFQRLQGRALLSRRVDLERAAVETPAAYFVFDLLGFEGFDLRELPLERRKELLAGVLPPAGPVRLADHVVERGEDLFAAAAERGLEGLVAKRADAPYRPGRSPAWLKVRSDLTGDYAVVGFTEPEGLRGGFGALHLACREGERWVYAGRVGSGFSNGQLGSIRKQLEAWRREQPPLAPGGAELPRGPEHVWVEPRLVAEVRYKETTGGGQLRHPVFVRLRDDKAPEECVRDSLEHPEEPPAPPAPPPEASGPRRRLRLSNLDKVFWPGEGLTKGDLVAYYRAVAPALLPYLADRPVVLDRFPDGIEGKSFFQKNAPDGTPEWVRTEAVTAEDGKITRYLVADDEDTLLHLVNLGSIPLHLWASRVGSLQHPDWCILDLDAKDAPFAAAVEVARAAGELCRELGLTPYLKTSGASGLHVLLPLGGRVTHDQARQLAELLARLLASQLPALASVARLPQARAGKVYVDYLQNGFGKLLVAPYSVRPRPGAPVSTPLSWEELGPGLDPRHFTMATVPPRLAERGDPLAPVLAAASDLPAALARLARRVGKEG